jgi:hypothetical protein
MAVLTIDEISIGDEYSKTVLFDKERVVEFINFTQDTASMALACPSCFQEFWV